MEPAMTADINDHEVQGPLDTDPHEIERHCLRRPRFERPNRPRGTRLYDPDLQLDENTIQTLNRKGYSMKNQDVIVRWWLDSLPDSKRPLLDLGAGHGFHTATAIRQGRDVIAVDEEIGHVDLLRQRVQKVLDTGLDDTAPCRGRLIDSKAIKLPNKDAFSKCSAAGVLLLQVMHFLKPGEPLQLFRDIYEWLEPGGRLVVATLSPSGIHIYEEANISVLKENRSAEEAWELINTAPDEVLLETAPLLVTNPKLVHGERVSDYVFSLQELLALARLTGFEIDFLDYVTIDCYVDPFSLVDNCSLLVARKPRIVSS